MQLKFTITADTPLSALFRENHHEELRTIIESWRPYLVNDDPTVDAHRLAHFEFDLKRICPKQVYLSLVNLILQDALRPPMVCLAQYMFTHSNLSKNELALYKQLKRYKKICL